MAMSKNSIIEELFRDAIQITDDVSEITELLRDKFTQSRDVLFSEYPDSDVIDEGYFNVFMNHVFVTKTVDDFTNMRLIDKIYVFSSFYYGKDIKFTYKVTYRRYPNNGNKVSPNFVSITRV